MDRNSILDTRGLFVLHAVLLRTGKLLLFSGHAESMHYPEVSWVFDPDDPGNMKRAPFPTGTDLFCCHYVQVADGQILAVGGSAYDFQTESSMGAKNICLFDPEDEEWENTGEELNEGRWYPTPVVLGDGRVIIVSGRREPRSTRPSSPNNPPANKGPIAETVEVFDPGAFDWEAEIVDGADKLLPLYPGLHLAPNGRIYYTHTNWGQQLPEPNTMALQVTEDEDSGTWTEFPGRMPAQPRREEGMSVLLPPAQDGKILVIGGSEAQDSSDVPVLQNGGTSAFDHIADPADPTSAEILDTTTNPPTWSPTPGPGLQHGRINGHCVLLPDRTVLIVGGHDNYKWNSIADGTTPSLMAELFEPGVGFSEMVPMAHPRMYHSVALLLPDGRVFVAGGADANGTEPLLAATYPPGWVGPTYGAGVALNRKDYQFYEPRYFFNGARPSIAAVMKGDEEVEQIEYGDTFVVRTPEAATITNVGIMRPGAPTHHTDSEQRYVTLTFTPVGGGSNDLTVTAPALTERSIAPPGWYMLWIEAGPASPGAGGRPCVEAEWIQLTDGCRLCLVASVALGSQRAPEVVYLRRLRSQLARGTGFGRRFVACVNRVYYSFSPALSKRLAKPEHAAARAALRGVVVRPGFAAVRAADAVTRPVRPKPLRHALLIALLVAELAAALALSPLWLTLLLVAALLRRRQADAD